MDWIPVTLVVLIILSQLKIYRLLRKNTLKDVMIFEIKIEECLADIIRSTCVDRALLVRIHNGGGRITIGNDKKISVVCEPEESLLPHTKEGYKNVPVDRGYRGVLIEMLDKKEVFVYNQTLDLRYSMLRRKAEADNLTATLHYFIWETRASGYYVFLATQDEPHELIGRPKKINLIEEKVHEIRVICRRADRVGILK